MQVCPVHEHAWEVYASVGGVTRRVDCKVLWFVCGVHAGGYGDVHMLAGRCTMGLNEVAED